MNKYVVTTWARPSPSAVSILAGSIKKPLKNRCLLRRWPQQAPIQALSEEIFRNFGKYIIISYTSRAFGIRVSVTHIAESAHLIFAHPGVADLDKINSRRLAFLKNSSPVMDLTHDQLSHLIAPTHGEKPQSHRRDVTASAKMCKTIRRQKDGATKIC